MFLTLKKSKSLLPTVKLCRDGRLDHQTGRSTRDVVDVFAEARDDVHDIYLKYSDGRLVKVAEDVWTKEDARKMVEEMDSFLKKGGGICKVWSVHQPPK